MDVILLLTTFFLNLNIAHSKDKPGMPESHKEALDKILTNFLNDQDADGAIFQYLFGINSDQPSAIDFDNLDIATLDTDSLKKIVKRAKEKYDQLESGRQAMQSGRRAMQLSKAQSDMHLGKEFAAFTETNAALFQRKDLVVIAFDFMKQAIYTTRYRLRETAKFRNMFSKTPEYQIGVMIGSIMELKIKMAHMYASMSWFKVHTHFVWYLILYEKMLAAFTDIQMQIDRIYMVHLSNIRKKAKKPGRN